MSVFVFGSNKAGIHGAGAAAYAHKHLDAKMGVGEGRTGLCYALPTKGHKIEFIPLEEVKEAVDRFIAYAKEHTETTFQVTRVGCGLGGFTDEEIAPLFEHAPDNCEFDAVWGFWLGEERTFWGTF